VIGSDDVALGPAGRLGRFFINSKLTPLLVLAALGLGALAVKLTPREEEPQIVVPIVDIYVAMPGATPEEVENRITVPLEKRMWEIPGVEYVYSSSRDGMAIVTARFFVGDDQEESLVKVHEKLASGMGEKPPGALPPLFGLRTIDDVPILTLTLWSHHYGSYELRRIAAELERELAKIADVSKIGLHGGERRAVRLRLDRAQLAAHGLDPAAIARALQMQSVSAPAGSFEEGNREVLVKTEAFLRSSEEVRELVVGVADGRPIHLDDVAEILDGPEDPSSHVYFQPGAAAHHAGIEMPEGVAEALPAVTLSLAKRKGADAQRVVDQVERRLADLEGWLLPPEVEVTVTRDYGATATEKANELLTHLGFAILSVSIVIGLALGWRGALVVFISVPISFALTLFVYYGFGYTLNRVTLFALVFVTGIVVDDSIIVVENIVRHLAHRKDSVLKSAIEAVNEVGNPTILATLTVIAAVLPMAFVRGLMGPYMRPMPVGAALAMTFSLGVALVVAPYFSYRLLRNAKVTHEDEEAGIRSTRIYRVYRRLVGPLLESAGRRWLFLGSIGALLLVAVAFFPLRWVEVKMLPFDNKSEVQVLLDMDEGTTLETTTAVARELADYLEIVPEVTDLQIYAGTPAPINFNGLVRYYDLREAPNLADLQVNLVHKEDRADQSHAIAQRIRPPLVEIAERHGAIVKVVEVPPGPPVLSTLVAEIYGPTPEARRELAAKVREIFEETPGVVDVDWRVEEPQAKMRLSVDREKAALQGVAVAQVAEALSLAFGAEVAQLHDPDEAEAVPIRLELPRAQRSGLEPLLSLRVASNEGALVPLAELVRVDESVLEPSRDRKNLKPVVYVTGDVAGEVESPVYAILDMAEKIAEIERPGGVPVPQLYKAAPFGEQERALKWDGEWQITYEVFRDLGSAFAVVLVLIYVLLIGWFSSFRAPLVMMIAIPLSLVGIVPGHFLFGAFFTATSMIGFIALAGIMVRNSVLLIDFLELSLERGRSLHDAVLEAGAVRFRPILLTAGTVVVGAFVILFDPIFQGLAISLMFGTLASTVLTLVVVPVVYYMTKRHDDEIEAVEEAG